jgi:hypothetical protein
MKRSNREGPLADVPSARVRFAAEAGFLVLVAVGAALADLRPLVIIILMACALLLVALIERASWRETGRTADRVEPDFEPAQPGPAVTTRPLDLPGLEEPAPSQAPAPAPSRSRFLQRPARAAAPPVPAAPPAPPPAMEWNIWELERLARQDAGDVPRDEQWSALFTHLRPFANADGVLPKEFDDLVRESFGQLIEAA